MIPANLHFNVPNPDIPALRNGNIEVVTESTKWPGGRVGISSYGFGGANVHAIVESNKIERKHKSGNPTTLFVNSGRTTEWVDDVLSLVQEHPLNVELQVMLDAQINLPVQSHPARGYVLLSGNLTSEVQVITCLMSEISEFSTVDTVIWL